MAASQDDAAANEVGKCKFFAPKEREKSEAKKDEKKQQQQQQQKHKKTQSEFQF